MTRGGVSLNGHHLVKEDWGMSEVKQVECDNVLEALKT